MKRLFDSVRHSRAADLALFALVVLVLLGVLRLMPVPDASTPEGRASVIDGDSLIVAGVEVRLQGIDAPEARQTCTRQGRDWDCGREASRRLAGLLRGGHVRCEGREEDEHGRLLARCRLGDADINRWMVEQGWAVSFGGYEGPEGRARAAKRGLWAGQFERPGDWRADNRGF